MKTYPLNPPTEQILSLLQENNPSARMIETNNCFLYYNVKKWIPTREFREIYEEEEIFKSPAVHIGNWGFLVIEKKIDDRQEAIKELKGIIKGYSSALNYVHQSHKDPVMMACYDYSIEEALLRQEFENATCIRKNPDLLKCIRLETFKDFTLVLIDLRNIN